MDAQATPKHKVLLQFAAVLLRRNPMQLSQDNPLEYESEALSILSRFNEAALHLADDEAAVAQVATSIVKQSLEFWFNDIGSVDPEPIARELVAVYRAAAEGGQLPNDVPVAENVHFVGEPEEESEVPKQVTSVTIGE